MQDRAILDINIASDTDGVYIAPKDGVEPHTASITEDDIPDDGSIDCEEAIFSDLRGKASYGLYESHRIEVDYWVSRIIY
jgi:hypothetical protein